MRKRIKNIFERFVYFIKWLSSSPSEMSPWAQYQYDIVTKLIALEATAEQVKEQARMYETAVAAQSPLWPDPQLPEPFKPVLADIRHISETGAHQWYEVVYHGGDAWRCYAGSKTFKDGESVARWRYANEAIEQPDESDDWDYDRYGWDE